MIILIFLLGLFGQSPQAERTQQVTSYDVIHLTGKFDPAGDTAFVNIAAAYTTRTGIYLRKEAYKAFCLMADSAKKDGIILKIVSATRNFDAQKIIWEDKWNGRKLVGGKYLNVSCPDPVTRAKTILLYSSMPGTSRHHWGTDVDINSVAPSYFQTAQGKKELQWLETHAAHFGFCRPYVPFGDKRSTGYQPEEWHWSYMPLAGPLLQEYLKTVTYNDIVGFDGDETVFEIRVIEQYVKGVNSDCK